MRMFIALVLMYMFGVASSYTFQVGRVLGSNRQHATALHGYKDMLAAAQANRGKPAQQQQRSSEQSAPQDRGGLNSGAPLQPQQQQHQQRVPRAPNPNGLPFDDEMYDHLKYTIDKITQRMKSPKLLTSDEIRRFDNAVEAIIADSQGMALPNPSSYPSSTSSQQTQQQAPPSPPPPSPPPQANFMTFQPKVVRGPDRGDGLKPSSPGNSWVAEQGKWSQQLRETAAANSKNSVEHEVDVGNAASWQIPGMESMSSDEYYAAINKRVAAAKVHSLLTFFLSSLIFYFMTFQYRTFM